MAYVLPNQAALSAAAETTYGTLVVPTDALMVSGDVDLTHDDTFAEQEYLRLSSSGEAPVRKHNKLDLSFTAGIGPMPDIINGSPSIHPLLIASGHAVDYEGTTPGAGNFVEYTPKSFGFGSATLYYYYKEDGAGNRSILQHVGTRGNVTLSITPGEDFQLQFDGSALHAFPAPFASVTDPGTYGKGLTPPVYPNSCWRVTLDKGAGPEPAKLVSFELNRGLEVVDNADDVTACGDGVSEIEVTAGQISGTLVIDFEPQHIATSGDDNFWYALEHANGGNLDFEVVLTRDDSVQEVTITIPRARFTEVQVQSGDRRRQLTMPFIAQPVTGDDEYKLRWEVL